MAITNAASKNPGSRLPDPLGNPYAGVGSFAQIHLAWRDIFGNTTVTPFETPDTNYRGVLNGQPLPLRYTDRLLPVSAWPSTSVSYDYRRGSNEPELAISFKLDASAYNPPGSDDVKTRATKDLDVFTRIFYQLNQSYQGLGLPWCEGPAVTVTLANSLLANPDTRLDMAQTQPLRDFVNGAIRYLHDIAAGVSPAPQPPDAFVLKLPVSLDELATGDLIPLSLTLTLTRDPDLVEPTVAALDGGISVTSSLLPTASKQPDASPYAEFARNFEAIFKRDGTWSMRVGTGTANPGSTPDGRSQTLWAIRFAEKDGEAGIRYRITPTPGYFAPRPIARSLTTATVEIIPTYDPNQPFDQAQRQPLTFTGIDQNAWFETVLKAIDEFLSPAYTPLVFLLDRQNPAKNDLLGKILSHKQTLANAIASTIAPILSTGPQEGPARAAAGEKLRQALLNRLASAYTITTSIGFEACGLSANGPVVLYGQPVISGGKSGPNGVYSFTTGRIPLGREHKETSLAFLFESKNESGHAYMPVDLTYRIGHLEHDIREVPGIKDYTQSNWISLIGEPINVPLANGQTINIPVPLRTLPEPPTLRSQSAIQTIDKPKSPADLARWIYSFDYLYGRAAQDVVDVVVQLNIPNPTTLADKSAGSELVTALAQFVAVYPQIESTMQEALTALDAGKIDHDRFDAAHRAVSAFETIVSQVASAYQAWATPILGRAFAILPQPLEVRFRVALTPIQIDGDEVAETTVLDTTINANSASYSPETGTISADINGVGQVVLPAPVVEIDPGHYKVEKVDSSGSSIRYRYRKNVKPPDPAPYLSYQAALADPMRRVAMAGLNAFAHQDAWASISTERNRILFPVQDVGKIETNPDFLFCTPSVRFADRVSPQLIYESFPLVDKHGTLGTVQEYLVAFYTELGNESRGTIVKIGMEGHYTYNLNASLPELARTVLPIALLLTEETSLAPGDTSFVASFSAAVEQWLREKQATMDIDANLEFSITVFAADDPAHLSTGMQSLDNQPPLLTIQNLQLKASPLLPAVSQ